ncbi:MAG: DUF4149 domain-containing protein [Azoarcus sp.]|nr:DUF4149 domain-containing protein [Azoarcus sp.]
MSVTSEAPGNIARGLLARQAGNLLLILVTLWAGALWTVGFVVAPTLFELLPERALAGAVAGYLFTSVHWIAAVAGGYVLAFALVRHGRAALRSGVVWLVVAMLAIVAIGALGIQPMIADLRSGIADDATLRDRFALWHGVSSALYALTCVLAVVLVLRVRRLTD